jgi:hypothetical protein
MQSEPRYAQVLARASESVRPPKEAQKRPPGPRERMGELMGAGGRGGFPGEGGGFGP